MDEGTSRDFQPQKQTVFKSEGEWVYRIPALFYESESETLLAFAEQRSSPADEHTKNLVMKTGKLRSEESSDVRTIEWSELKLVKEARIDQHRPMNPCPVYEKTKKRLFLFFICVEGTISEARQIQHSDNKARLCYITSDNLGQSWSDVTDLTDELSEIKSWSTFAVGPGHGIQMRNGRLIVPTYAYVSCCNSRFFSITSKKGAPYALPLYSEDLGKTWQFGKKLEKESIECEMAEFVDDEDNSFVYCNARRKGGYRVEVVSGCNGDDISQSKSRLAEKLVETGRGCHGSVVSFPAQSKDARSDGEPAKNPNKWLLFSHPDDKHKRINLGVYLNKSPQDPNAWSEPWIINSGPSGYSDLAYIDGGRFACLMECGEQKEIEQIASVVFSYDEVKQRIGG